MVKKAKTDQAASDDQVDIEQAAEQDTEGEILRQLNSLLEMDERHTVMVHRQNAKNLEWEFLENFRLPLEEMLPEMLKHKYGSGKYRARATHRGTWLPNWPRVTFTIAGERTPEGGDASVAPVPAPAAPSGESLSDVIAFVRERATLKGLLESLQEGKAPGTDMETLVKLATLLKGGGDESRTLMELYKDSAQTNRELMKLLFEKRETDDKGDDEFSKFNNLIKLAEAMGWETKRSGEGEGGTNWAQVAEHFAPIVGQSIEALREAIATQRGRPRMIKVPAEGLRVAGQSEQPEKPTEGGDGMAQGGNPQWEEIVNAVIGELTQEQKDFAGLAAFLETVIISPQGDTLLDRLEPMTRTSPGLAKISLKAVDARLVAEHVWPGVLDFLRFMRDEAMAAQPGGGAEE